MNHLTIEDKAGKLRLTEVVHKESVDRMIDQIGRLFGAKAAAEGADFGVIMNAAENAVDTLEIEINSPGGSVFDGYTIYNEIKSLRERGVEVTATITGMAASMASVIAMAATRIRMVPHARMMIHDAQQVVGGNADKLRQSANLLDGISADIANIYANRTGKPVEEIRAMMKKETWMSAKEAVEKGFADEVFDIRAENPTPMVMNILKVLFPQNEAELSKVESALAEVDSLRADLSTATAEVEALKAEITAKDQTIAEHVAAIASKEERITELSAKVDEIQAQAAEQAEVIKAKDAEIEAAKESAGKLAVEQLAAIGQSAPLPTSTETAPVSHLAVFNALKGAEATAYFNKFQKEIAAEQRAATK